MTLLGHSGYLVEVLAGVACEHDHHHGLGEPAMAKVLALMLGLTMTRQQLTAVFCCLALTPAYYTISGLWAVLWTDMVQFILKFSMVILLAYFAVQAMGAMHSLTNQVRAPTI